MSARQTTVLVRSVYGTAAVQWFLIFAIGTILVTRAYLRLTGYPQIGNGTLHIAHALWGGALMMLALVFGWLLLGSTPRVVAVVMGGIGFGLFLDEVGKFVTKDNDYFYGPSAEIMYLLVVLILLISRFVRDLKRPSVPEAIANAAVIAADGVAHGLPESRRRQAADLLDFAEARDADPALVTHIRGLLDASVDTPDRLTRVRARALALIPNFFRRRWWVTLIGWLLVVSSALTLACSASAMIGRRHTDRVWPLRALRMAALVFTMANALVDFALDGFGALYNLALGLFALAIIDYHLRAAVARASANHEHGQLRV